MNKEQFEKRTKEFASQFVNKRLEGEFDLYDIKAIKNLLVKGQRYEEAARVRDTEKEYLDDEEYDLFMNMYREKLPATTLAQQLPSVTPVLIFNFIKNDTDS